MKRLRVNFEKKGRIEMTLSNNDGELSINSKIETFIYTPGNRFV